MEKTQDNAASAADVTETEIAEALRLIAARRTRAPQTRSVTLLSIDFTDALHALGKKLFTTALDTGYPARGARVCSLIKEGRGFAKNDAPWTLEGKMFAAEALRLALVEQGIAVIPGDTLNVTVNASPKIAEELTAIEGTGIAVGEAVETQGISIGTRERPWAISPRVESNLPARASLQIPDDRAWCLLFDSRLCRNCYYEQGD